MDLTIDYLSIGILIGFSLISFIFSTIALIHCEAMRRSTHHVQYVPLKPPVAPRLFETDEEAIKKKLDQSEREARKEEWDEVNDVLAQKLNSFEDII